MNPEQAIEWARGLPRHRHEYQGGICAVCDREKPHRPGDPPVMRATPPEPSEPRWRNGPTRPGGGGGNGGTVVIRQIGGQVVALHPRPGVDPERMVTAIQQASAAQIGTSAMVPLLRAMRETAAGIDHYDHRAERLRQVHERIKITVAATLVVGTILATIFLPGFWWPL